MVRGDARSDRCVRLANYGGIEETWVKPELRARLSV